MFANFMSFGKMFKLSAEYRQVCATYLMYVRLGLKPCTATMSYILTGRVFYF